MKKNTAIAAGYAKQGWVETDELGRIVVGAVGFKVYRYKKDILDEIGQYADVAKALIVVDVPKKIRS